MSLQIPVVAQIPRPKAMFYFYSPLQTVFDSPKVSDTTSVSTGLTSRSTLKTYSLSLPSNANTIRVIIYGYVNGATGYVILNIDGVDVRTATTIALSETIIMDYIGSISPGAREIKIDGYISASGSTLHITRIFIATGIGVTTTTLTDLRTITVTYQLLRSGDIRYSPGVRLFVYGNRKTTATARLEVGSSPITGRNQLGAGNDNAVAETFLAIVTGSVTLQEGGEFTVSATLRGRVGASGDVVIITRILARAQLRRELGELGEVRIFERGVVNYSGRLVVVPVPGGGSSASHLFSQRDVRDSLIAWIHISAGGTDVSIYNFSIPVVAPTHFRVDYDHDAIGETFLMWVQVVVLG